MLADCRAGKIDMILTKSIARFARNTVTLLAVVRELKALGVNVWFERENIHSISGDGELLLTILASFSQEESRSTSDNCKWRIRKRYEQGEPVSLRFLYGYRITKDSMEIDPEQAAIVRMIFNDYIGGMGGVKIAQKLREMNAPRPLGGKWTDSCVRKKIANEKYIGDSMLQKTYVSDHLSKKVVRNRGELTRYYTKNTHPAIIDEEVFQKAQEVLAERQQAFNVPGGTRNQYPFTAMITCGRCGTHFRRKTAHGRKYWNCAAYLREGTKGCRSKQIPEDTLILVAAEVLGLDAFDESVFAKRVEEIRVPGDNRLVFVFRDGHTVERTWQDRSRSESWTEDMRREAGKRQREAVQRRQNDI
jgi:DNA invertase Pin-like site-specific DNA recombinase